MPEQLMFYVQVSQDPAEFAERLAAQVAAVPGVLNAEADVEEHERGAIEVLNEVTLTVTAAGGVVAATGALVTQVQELLVKLKARRAEVETSDGEVRQLEVVPMNENPPQ